MPHPAPAPDLRHEVAELRHALVAAIERFEGRVCPAAATPAVQSPAAPVAASDTPHDGDTRPGQIWLSGGWVSLRPKRLKLLAYALGEGNGVTWQKLCEAMFWRVRRADAQVRIAELNHQLAEEMSGKSRLPVVSLEGGLHVEWKDVAANGTKTA